jgi:PAS domain S-box-containing protein
MRQPGMSLSASLRHIAGAPEVEGLSLDEFLALVHPDDRSQVTTIMRPGGKTASRVALCRFRRPSGEVRWTVLRADSSRRVDGDGRKSVGLVIDLTPSYEAYRVAHDSLDHGADVAATFDRAPVALLLTDGTRIEAVNDVCAGLLGRSTADLCAESVDAGVWQRLNLPALAAALRDPKRLAMAQLVRLTTHDGASTLVLAALEALTHQGRSLALVGLVDASLRFDHASDAEEAFRRLADATSEGLALVEDGVLVECNDALAEALGFAVEELIGRRLVDLADPDMAELVASELAEPSVEPQPWRLVHRDGRRLPFEAATRTVVGIGATARVLAFRDLSERERADRTLKALEASREQFRELAEAHGDGVVLLDGERVVHANRKFASMLGLDLDDLLGESLAAFTTPDSRRLFAISGDAEDPFVVTLARPDGTTVSADVAPRAVKADGRTYRVATVRDVTRRERAERLRRAAFAGTAGVAGTAFFQALVDHLAAAMQAKHAFIAEFEGTPPAHVATISVWAHGAPGAPVRRPLAGTPCEIVMWHGAQCFPRDVTALFPTDAWLASLGAVGYFGAPLFDSSGHALGILGVVDDEPMARTDEREDLMAVLAARASVELQRSRFEAEIRRLNADLELRVADRTAQLQAANRELEAFSYSVSHDLRAPVRQIGAFVDRLQRDAPALSPSGREHLTDIGRSASHMSTLIDTLLEFSRAARTEMEAGVVDISEIAAGVAADLRSLADGRQIDWRLGSVPPVRGDRVLLRQVLVNLLGNAFKYTRGRDVARIELGTVATTPAGEVVWFVRDNGVGFDMKRASKLFGVFQRLHAASEFEGTGIGLAHVHQIVSRHGGRVWAEASVNQGATFFVALPAVTVLRVAAS